MIVDTSAILAFFDRDEPDHDALIALLSTAVYNSAWLTSVSPPVIPPQMNT